jgi:hypothetical protein
MPFQKVYIVLRGGGRRLPREPQAIWSSDDDRREVDMTHKRMVIEKAQKPAVALNTAIEGRELALPSPLNGDWRAELERRRSRRTGEANRKERLGLIAEELPLHGESLPHRRQPIDECHIGPLTPFVEAIPLVARGRNVEKLNFVRTPRHRIR